MAGTHLDITIETLHSCNDLWLISVVERQCCGAVAMLAFSILECSRFAAGWTVVGVTVLVHHTITQQRTKLLYIKQCFGAAMQRLLTGVQCLA